MPFSVTSYVNLWFAEVQIIGCMDLSKDPKSHRILPDSITEYHSARLARLPSNTKAKSRALLLCCKWKLVPPPSSGLATLISRQNRCALRCRVVPTGRVHWFTLWATGLLLQRVYECIRMNKTRVRLVGIDSEARCTPLANVKSAVPPRKCARITLPENAEIEFPRFSVAFPTSSSSAARKIDNNVHRYVAALFFFIYMYITSLWVCSLNFDPVWCNFFL